MGLQMQSRGGRRLVEPLFATYVANALSGRAKFFLLLLPVSNKLFLSPVLLGAALFWSVSRLRARPKGAALWNPAAVEQAGEACSLRYALPYFGAQLH